MLLPGWMNEDPVLNNYTRASSSGRRSNFIGKTIRNMRAIICEDMQTERLARQDGFLQKVDPRVKLISMIMLILGASLSRQISVLLIMWGFTVMLMYLSRLPILVLQKRIWGFIPLFTLLCTLPVTLNIFIDGIPLITIYQTVHPSNFLGICWPDSLYVSQQGAMAAVFLFLRVGISLSLGVLLVMTTPVAAIFKSLIVLRVPTLFIMIIEMTYRYLLLLLAISIEMFEARSIRTVGDMSASWQRAQVGSSIGALFARSMALSEEVYQAMTARCYTGEINTGNKDEWGRLDLSRDI